MLPLTLNALEVCFLTDSINNRDLEEGREDARQQPLARQTLLLLGGAYLELVQEEKEPDENLTVTLQISEEIAWLLRSKVKSGDVGFGGQMIGVGLLRKLYDLILQFNSGVEFPAAVDGVDRKFREVQDAITRSEQDARSDENNGT